MFHDIRLRPGEGAIEVHFDRLGGDTPAAVSKRRDDARGAGGPAEPRGETVPPHLSLEQRLRIRPREVVLVTYAPDRRALIAVQDPNDVFK